MLAKICNTTSIVLQKLKAPIIFGKHNLVAVNKEEVTNKLLKCAHCKDRITVNNQKSAVALPCGDVLDIDCLNSESFKQRCTKCDACINSHTKEYTDKQQYIDDNTILKCKTPDCYYAISKKNYLAAKLIDENKTVSEDIVKIQEASNTCPYNGISFSHEPRSSEELLEPDNLKKIEKFLVNIMENKGILCSSRINEDNSITLCTASMHTCAEYNINEYVNDQLSAHSTFSKFLIDVEKDLLFSQLFRLYPEFFIKSTEFEPRLEGRTKDELILFNGSEPETDFTVSFNAFLDASKMSFDFDKLRQECNKFDPQGKEYRPDFYACLFTKKAYEVFSPLAKENRVFRCERVTLNALPSGKLPASTFIMLPTVD